MLFFHENRKLYFCRLALSDDDWILTFCFLRAGGRKKVLFTLFCCQNSIIWTRSTIPAFWPPPPPSHTSVILACSFVTREENSVTRFFTPLFMIISHPAHYSYSEVFSLMISNSLRYSRVQKLHSVNDTAEFFLYATVKLVFIMTSGSF